MSDLRRIRFTGHLWSPSLILQTVPDSFKIIHEKRADVKYTSPLYVGEGNRTLVFCYLIPDSTRLGYLLRFEPLSPVTRLHSLYLSLVSFPIQPATIENQPTIGHHNIHNRHLEYGVCIKQLVRIRYLYLTFQFLRWLKQRRATKYLLHKIETRTPTLAYIIHTKTK